MCRADTTLLTYEWYDDWIFPQPVPNLPRQCVNWEGLQGWAIEREFDINELVHPKLGKLFFSPWCHTCAQDFYLSAH